jgi:hypothetical protein
MLLLDPYCTGGYNRPISFLFGHRKISKFSSRPAIRQQKAGRSGRDKEGKVGKHHLPSGNRVI